MFVSNDIINFNFEGSSFTLSDFRFQILDKPYPMHYHSENSYEIHFIEEGNLILQSDKDYRLSNDHLFITGPFINHGQIPLSNVKKYSIYFTIEKTTNSSLLDIFLNKKFFITKNDAYLTFFKNLEKELKERKIGYIHYCIELLKQLLITIIRDYNKNTSDLISKSTPNNTLFNIEAIFLKEFSTITLEELSKKLFLTKRMLQRMLKKHYKKTFNELKNEARMSYSKNELLNSNKTISEIATLTGYSASEHFVQAFKKHFNLTPLQYRKKHKKKNE